MDVSTHLDRDWDCDFATWRAVHEGDILHNIADRVDVHHPWLQHMHHTLLAERTEAEKCMVLPQVPQAADSKAYKRTSTGSCSSPILM